MFSLSGKSGCCPVGKRFVQQLIFYFPPFSPRIALSAIVFFRLGIYFKIPQSSPSSAGRLWSEGSSLATCTCSATCLDGTTFPPDPEPRRLPTSRASSRCTSVEEISLSIARTSTTGLPSGGDGTRSPATETGSPSPLLRPPT